MKFLIVGLGNIGSEYRDTRHNIGFNVLDALAEASNTSFSTQRYGDVATMRLKNQNLVLLKPSTYMNLSGDAVRYWKTKENIEVENILVVVDDLSLPFGAIRMKGKGSDGQIDYVLGHFTAEQREAMPERIKVAVEAIKSFCLAGLPFTMTHFNNK